MKIIHSSLGQIKAEKKPKRVPMDKDPVFIAELRRSIIEDHNKKLKIKKLKELLDSGAITQAEYNSQKFKL